MSLLRYTPYALTNLQQQINRMFDQFDPDLVGRSEELGGGMFAPPMDVKEDAEAYHVFLEVPGVTSENLNITLQENTLSIRGQKARTQEHQGQYRRVERSYGSFARSLTLPRHVDGNAVTANLHDGVLEVRLPKKEEAKPRQIAVGTVTAGSATAAGSASAHPGASTPAATTDAIAGGPVAERASASRSVSIGESGKAGQSQPRRT